MSESVGLVTRTFRIVVPNRRWDGEAGTWVDLEPTQATVLVTVDLEGIATALGGRAVRNKNGKAGIGGKLVTVKRVEVR